MDVKYELERDNMPSKGEIYHIDENISDPVLKKIDDIYVKADSLSVKYAKKHQKILMSISFTGTLLTMFFLIYDEAYVYSMIYACAVMTVFLFLIKYLSDRTQWHKKYIEYRVLAESLRIQYYLFYSGIREKASMLMPWLIKQDLPWVEEMIEDLQYPKKQTKKSIRNCWIEDQLKYHKKALNRTELKNRRDRRVRKISVIITISIYLVTLVFELLVYKGMMSGINIDVVRAALKIIVGTMAALALFTGGYYGKMSLENVADDHRRMINLYDTCLKRIEKEGESKELLLFLAKECMNENSTWYAYQRKNKPDLVI